MSFSPTDFLVRLPTHLRLSLGLEFSERDGYGQNKVITDEVQDIMVDVMLIFLSLPVLAGAPAVVDEWFVAFERLFDTVRGLKYAMNPELARPHTLFEGRTGRFYLELEEELFVTCFFQEFYDMLSNAHVLGEFKADDTWSDPFDDLLAVYKFVREKKFGPELRRRKERASSMVPQPSLDESIAGRTPPDKAEASTLIKKYLTFLVDFKDDCDTSTDHLIEVAKAIDAAGSTPVCLFFQSFKKSGFAKLYRPVKNNINGEILVDVLTRYYFEYVADPRLFNPPTYETIVKDMRRDRRCDTET